VDYRASGRPNLGYARHMLFFSGFGFDLAQVQTKPSIYVSLECFRPRMLEG